MESPCLSDSDKIPNVSDIHSSEDGDWDSENHPLLKPLDIKPGLEDGRLAQIADIIESTINASDKKESDSRLDNVSDIHSSKDEDWDTEKKPLLKPLDSKHSLEDERLISIRSPILSDSDEIPISSAPKDIGSPISSCHNDISIGSPISMGPNEISICCPDDIPIGGSISLSDSDDLDEPIEQNCPSPNLPGYAHDHGFFSPPGAPGANPGLSIFDQPAPSYLGKSLTKDQRAEINWLLEQNNASSQWEHQKKTSCREDRTISEGDRYWEVSERDRDHDQSWHRSEEEGSSKQKERTGGRNEEKERDGEKSKEKEREGRKSKEIERDGVTKKEKERSPNDYLRRNAKIEKQIREIDSEHKQIPPNEHSDLESLLSSPIQEHSDSDSNDWSCSFCKQTITDSEESGHLKTHIDCLFQCGECRFGFIEYQKVQEHVRVDSVYEKCRKALIQQPNAKFLTLLKCGICFRQFMGQLGEIDLFQHIKEIHGKHALTEKNMLSLCRICEDQQTFGSIESLSDHIRQQHASALPKFSDSLTSSTSNSDFEEKGSKLRKESSSSCKRKRGSNKTEISSTSDSDSTVRESSDSEMKSTFTRDVQEKGSKLCIKTDSSSTSDSDSTSRESSDSKMRKTFTSVVEGKGSSLCKSSSSRKRKRGSDKSDSSSTSDSDSSESSDSETRGISSSNIKEKGSKLNKRKESKKSLSSLKRNRYRESSSTVKRKRESKETDSSSSDSDSTESDSETSHISSCDNRKKASKLSKKKQKRDEESSHKRKKAEKSSSSHKRDEESSPYSNEGEHLSENDQTPEYLDNLTDIYHQEREVGILRDKPSPSLGPYKPRPCEVYKPLDQHRTVSESPLKRTRIRYPSDDSVKGNDYALGRYSASPLDESQQNFRRAYCHFYNNDHKGCPYKSIECPFLHKKASECRFGDNCPNILKFGCCHFYHKDISIQKKILFPYPEMAHTPCEYGDKCRDIKEFGCCYFYHKLIGTHKAQVPLSDFQVLLNEHQKLKKTQENRPLNDGRIENDQVTSLLEDNTSKELRKIINQTEKNFIKSKEHKKSDSHHTKSSCSDSHHTKKDNYNRKANTMKKSINDKPMSIQEVVVSSRTTRNIGEEHGLRFLVGMEIRVKDKYKVALVAGRSGFVDKVSGPGSNKGEVLVILKNNCQVWVPSTDLEPLGLRFLEGMEIRVKDKCKVAQVAGRSGFVDKVSGPGSNKGEVLVILKNNSQMWVPSTDLEPFIPGLGDNAKSLNWGEREDVAKVVYHNEDEDIARVDYRGNNPIVQNMQIDHLCKVSSSHSQILLTDMDNRHRQQFS